MTDSEGVLVPLETWSSALFFVAGALLGVYSMFFATEAFMDTYPAVRDFLGPVGYIIGFVGLLGVYPALADRSPKLAPAGAVFAAVGIVGWLLSLLLRAEVLSGEPTAFGAMQALFILVGMILAFFAFAAASLRTDVHSRSVGLLLLGPFLVNALNFGIVIAGYASPEGRFVISGAWTISYLAIGVALRTEEFSTHPAESTPDATTR